MRIRGPIFVLALLAAASAQGKPDADAQWREQIRAADKDRLDTQPLKAALKIAEPFGAGDIRLFETLVRLAEACSDDEQDCGPKQGGYLDRALEMRAKVKPVDAHFADLLIQLASSATNTERYRDALIVYGEARAIREKLFGASDQSVAGVYAAEAWVYQYQKDSAQARRTMNYALGIRKQAGASRTEKYAALLVDSAGLYRAADDRPSSDKEYRQALAIQEKLWKRSDPRLAASIKTMADSNQFEKNPAFSEEMYRRVVDLQQSVHSAKSSEYYLAQVDLANLLRRQKRYAEAETRFAEALKVSRQLHNLEGAAFCLEEIARCRMDRGEYTGAAESAEASLDLRKQIGPPWRALALYGLLSEAYLRARDEKKSAARFATLGEKADSKKRSIVAHTADNLSKIYQERGDYPRAAEKLEQELANLELAALQSSVKIDNPEIPQVMIRLAQFYQTMGRTEDANRMNMAALRMAAGQSIRDSKINASPKQLLLGFAVLFIFIPAVGAVIVGFIYRLCARSVDRKLSLLYLRPARRPAGSTPTESMPDSAASAVEAAGDVVAAGSIAEVAEQEGAIAVAKQAVAQAERAEEGEFIAEQDGLVVVAKRPAVEEMSAAEAGCTAEQAGAPMFTEKVVPASRVELLAEGDVLFAIRVLNLLLSLLTLGTYSFWGKAKVRRYVCGQAEFQGDRFAFHGTGRELLLGWLRGLPVLAFIFLFPYVLPLVWQHKYSNAIAQSSAAVAFILLWPIARVGAYRYRLNRMSWRGIRFSYRGSALRFLGASLAGGLASFLTLGLFLPILQVRLRRLLFAQTYFGNRVFEFSGRAADLMVAWLFALPLTFCSFGIGWAWWSALRHRYYWAHTTYAGARFRCTVTGRQLLWLWVGNFLIIVPTIGLGMSWAMLRTLKFWTEHIELAGEADMDSVRQDVRATSALGESFADFLGFDFGF